MNAKTYVELDLANATITPHCANVNRARSVTTLQGAEVTALAGQEVKVLLYSTIAAGFGPSGSTRLVLRAEDARMLGEALIATANATMPAASE